MSNNSLNIFKRLVKSFEAMNYSEIVFILSITLTHFSLLQAKELEVQAASALIMDAGTGKILWGKDAHTKRYPASTTKIMTSLLVLERAKLDKMISIPEGVDQVGEASIGLKPFEQLSVKDLLAATMVKSANDAAYALAIHIGGSISNFAQLMNERAAQLGCKNTHFKNPHGLKDPDHLTTAHDLALMTSEAMKNPDFREIAKTQSYKLTRNDSASLTTITSKNKWLSIDPTADGVKTGWTIPAGQCYVGSATRKGQRVITVILKSNEWMKDHEAMLNWAFENHEWQCIAKKEEPLTQIKVENGLYTKIEAAPLVDLYCVKTINLASNPKFRYEIYKNIKAPIKKGMPLGVVYLTDTSGHEQKIPLVALKNIDSLETTIVQRNSTPPITTLLSLLLGSSVFTLFVGNRKK